MASEYFKNFASVKYEMPNGVILSVKDIFRKAIIEPEVADSLVDYTYYEIQDGERPDVVATRLYGDSNLYWLFYLVNDFDNFNSWHLSSLEFEKFLNDKYPGKYLTATASTNIVSSSSKFLLGERVTSASSSGNVIRVEPTYNRIAVEGGTWNANDVVTGASSGKSFTVSSVQEHRDGVNHYKNSSGLKQNRTGSGFSPVTHFEHELEHNEEKRKIKIIRPQFVSVILKQFNEVMSAPGIDG